MTIVNKSIYQILGIFLLLFPSYTLCEHTAIVAATTTTTSTTFAAFHSKRSSPDKSLLADSSLSSSGRNDDATGSSSSSSKHTLFDVPVSNNGARCRIILYKKQIPPSEVSILSPMDVGGLKSPEYLALNPQGKMPTLTVTSTGLSIPESDTICRYLLSNYADVGPSFLPSDPKSNLIARIHDIYLSPVQGSMYKASPPFGVYGTRKNAISEFRRQLDIINDLIDDKRTGQYLLGEEVSLADATLFPSMVFTNNFLPKFGIPEDEVLPPKVKQWYHGLIRGDLHFSRVHDELLRGIRKWENNGRWDTIWLAGLRDEDPSTIFDKIVSGEIPANIVRSDDDTLAFKDINPAAPAHILVIPKDRSGLSRITKSSPEHVELLGKLLVVAGDIAKDKSLGFVNGARLIINDGPDGGQEVPHLHIHVLGGRQLTWPPG